MNKSTKKATFGKKASTSKEEVINQFKKSVKIMNEKLAKLTDLTTKHEKKLHRIQTKIVEHQNNLSLLQEEKVQLRNEMIQKTNLWKRAIHKKRKHFYRWFETLDFNLGSRPPEGSCTIYG